jgi:hypothetical protein
VSFPNGGRHGLSPASNGDPFGHGLIEGSNPVDHRGLCCLDFLAHVCGQHRQPVNPRQEITGLLGDLLGDLGTMGLVLCCHQARRRCDKPAGLLG